MNNVLITGASGLIGREISLNLKSKNFNVWGTYNSNFIKEIEINWLFSDFSSLKNTREFLYKNKDILKNIDCLIHTYGPIVYKDTKDLKSEDFIKDFFDNTVVSYEILKYLISNSKIKRAIFFGFHELSEHKAYKKILTYSIAKNSLYDLLISLKNEYYDIDFKILSFTQIKGAEFEIDSIKSINSKKVSDKVYEIISKNYSKDLIVKI